LYGAERAVSHCARWRSMAKEVGTALVVYAAYDLRQLLVGPKDLASLLGVSVIPNAAASCRLLFMRGNRRGRDCYSTRLKSSSILLYYYKSEKNRQSARRSRANEVGRDVCVCAGTTVSTESWCLLGWPRRTLRLSGVTNRDVVCVWNRRTRNARRNANSKQQPSPYFVGPSLFYSHSVRLHSDDSWT
jgi:hypothetical protein